MGIILDRNTEVKCPSCGGNCKTRGGYIAKNDGKLMQRQYRECYVCSKRIITYKDLETKRVYYKGELLENTSKRK